MVLKRKRRKIAREYVGSDSEFERLNSTVQVNDDDPVGQVTHLENKIKQLEDSKGMSRRQRKKKKILKQKLSKMQLVAQKNVETTTKKVKSKRKQSLPKKKSSTKPSSLAAWNSIQAIVEKEERKISNQENFTKNKQSQKQKNLTLMKEISQLNQIFNHNQFQENPAGTIQQHLKNKIAIHNHNRKRRKVKRIARPTDVETLSTPSKMTGKRKRMED